MDTYAIYLRKSRADLEAEKLGEGETLKRHRAILTNLAAKQGLFVGKVFQEVVSGETIEARPQMQELIKECYEGKYKGIIIIDVDRLSRGNQGDMQIIMDCLKYSNNRDGLLVVTPTKTYDVAHSSDDEEYMEFVLFMSRREYKTIQKRLERGRKQAIVEGEYMGAYRPYGYNIVKTKVGRFLEPHPEEAEIVKKIFDWKVNRNMSAGAIARKLTALGVPTYTGAPEWSLTTIKTILTNPTYYGRVKWNDRMVIKSMVDGKMVRSRPRSTKTPHYMEYDGRHEALVTKEIFEAAAASYKIDKTKANLQLKNPLAGLVVCEKCGYMMIYNGYTKKDNVAPRILHRPSKLCNVKSVSLEDMMNAFVHALKLSIEDFQVKIDNTDIANEDDIQAQIAILEKEKKKIEKLLSKIFDDYEAEIYTPNEFVQRKAKHTNRIDNINAQIEELERSIPEKTEFEERISSLHEALDILKDPNFDAGKKNAYLKSFIEKVEYGRIDDDHFTLDIYFK